MKRILSLFLFAFLAKSSVAQWPYVGGVPPDIYYNAGKVYVGTSNYVGPTAPSFWFDVGSSTAPTSTATAAPQQNQILSSQFRGIFTSNGYRATGYFSLLQKSTNNTDPGPAALSAWAYSQYVGSGTIANLNAIDAAVEHRCGSVTLAKAYGVTSRGWISDAGNITDWVGFYSGGVDHNGGGTGTVTNGYGLYIASFNSTVTNKFAIYAPDANAKSQFAGTIQVDGTGSLILKNGSGFKFETGAVSGRILISDGSGNASWADPSTIAGCTDCWKLQGNSGVTDDATHYLGTSDDKPINFRVFGEKAGRIDGTAYNTFFGKYSGNANTSTGIRNAFYGQYSGTANTTGKYNTAIGATAFTTNTDGEHNTTVGYASLKNTTGDYNTGIGDQSDVVGDINNATAVGAAAVATISNTVQLGNAEVTKVFAGVGNTATTVTGSLQVTAGSPVTGQVLTAVDGTGLASWEDATSFCATCWSIDGNTGTTDYLNYVGTTDAVALNFGVAGTFSGRIEGDYPGTNHTTMLGYASGRGLTHASGTDNSGFGYLAMANTSTGSLNTAVGVQALFRNDGTEAIEANHNTAVGAYSLGNSTTGSWNTAVGSFAANTNSTGYANTSIGFATLEANHTGLDLTCVGYTAGTNADGYKNSGSFGASATVLTSNEIIIGPANYETVGGALIGGYRDWHNFSDGRFKENIKKDVPGLDFINKLEPVTYTVNLDKINQITLQNMPEEMRQRRLKESESYKSLDPVVRTGFIAQNVEKAAKEVGYDFDGVHVPQNKTDLYALAYGEFVVPLTKAVQELSKQNDDLKKELEELKALVKGKTEGSIKLDANSDAQLFQNAPNPFNKSTVIRYSIPFTAKKAVLKITSISGVSIKEFNLVSKAQSVEINGGELSAGTYVYSLFVDDVFIDSKQMILTK